MKMQDSERSSPALDLNRPALPGTPSLPQQAESEFISIDSREGILNSLPMFIYILTKEYTFSYVNECFRREFGIPDQYTQCYSLLRKCHKPCTPCPAMNVFSDGVERTWVWRDTLRGNVYEIHDIPFSAYDHTPRVLGVGFNITEEQPTARRGRQPLANTGKFLRICCHCKKIRNSRGKWLQMEAYFSDEHQLQFSHGICPDCMQQHYRGITEEGSSNPR